MARISSTATNATSEQAKAVTVRRGRRVDLLDDVEIDAIEQRYPDGISSREIVDVFANRGIRFSEATLRKYVQLGLLPRSVRVGRKGKHQGSRGLYPVNVVRRVNLVKGMMAENRTIEEIQRSLLRFKDEIDGIEKGLRALMAGFEREMRGGPGGKDMGSERKATDVGAQIETEILEAKRVAGELIRRIAGLEKRISTRDGEDPGAAVGRGSHLF